MNHLNPQSEHSHDNISNMILTHWKNYQPTMLAQFQKENRLETELEATAQQFTDLLFDLMTWEKMSYHEAWEIAVSQFFLPEEESLLTNQNQS